jgi:osmotically-inducible protein OsmY
VVRNGIVDLIGTVDAYVDSVRAEDLATRVNGVVAVNNHIVVNGGLDPYPYEPYVDDWYSGEFDYRYDPPVTFKSDLEIEKDIENEFFWSPFVDSDKIEVDVDNGAATLTGQVDSLSEFKAAGRNAYEGGAVIVYNKLEVQ